MNCNNCINQGALLGTSQETYCGHCMYGSPWKINHYRPKDSSSPVSADIPSAHSDISLTRIQAKKAKYLIEKGGKPGAVTVHISMPDGHIADIDPFGRVLWRNS